MKTTTAIAAERVRVFEAESVRFYAKAADAAFDPAGHRKAPDLTSRR